MSAWPSGDQFAFWRDPEKHSRPKRQHIGNQIGAAFVFARAHFVSVGVLHWWLVSRTAATA
jgi:hypothetical protein